MLQLKRLKRPSCALKKFARDEDGSFTLEAVIWMPIFAILLAIIMNLSMLFFYESQMLRVSQDATRAYSVGKFQDDGDSTGAQKAADYIEDRLSFIDAEFDINVYRDGFIAKTQVSTSAANLMPFSLMAAPFQNVPIGVFTQYIIEF